MTDTIVSLYNLLGINQKIQERYLRLLYLKESWGLPQKLIAACEGLAQPSISRDLKVANLYYGSINLDKEVNIRFTSDEISYLQKLPREFISDTTLISFVQNILNIYPAHSFYELYFGSHNARIISLASLGIQHIHLAKVFGKSPQAISMLLKRVPMESVMKDMETRYTSTEGLRLVYKVKVTPSFTLAGGNE